MGLFKKDENKETEEVLCGICHLIVERSQLADLQWKNIGIGYGTAMNHRAEVATYVCKSCYKKNKKIIKRE